MLFENQILQNKKRTIFILIIFSLFVFTISAIASVVLSLPLSLVIVFLINTVSIQQNLSTDYQTNRMIFISIFILFSLIFVLVNFYKTSLLYKKPIYKIMIENDAYALSPSQKKEFYPIIEGLALAAGVNAPQLFIIHTNSVNAFAISNNNNDSGIAVTQGLLNFLKRDELEGVLAHELAHILNKDSYINQLLLTINSHYGSFGMVFFSLSKVFFGSYTNTRKSSSSFKFSLLSIIFGIVAFIFFFVGKPFSLLFRMATSRQREYLADATAVELTRNPSGIINALKKMQLNISKGYIRTIKSSSSMFFFEPIKRRWSTLFSSHPTLEKRIDRLEQSK